MKLFLLVLSLFGSSYSSVTTFIPSLDDFSPLERQKIAQSMPIPDPKPTIILPTMAVKFDILINGDSIVYSSPVFTLDGVEVVCQVCGMPPCQIEMNNGKLKSLCFNHIAKKPRVIWE